MSAHLHTEVRAGDFDLGAETDALRAATSGVGAIASFVGLVRDLAEPGPVTGLELEHYPGMTERSMEAVAREALARWPLEGLRVIHRVGALEPGDQIVLVLAASAHRHAAFDACRFVMDYLKTRAVFWKRERYADGARWIESRADDFEKAARWERAGED